MAILRVTATRLLRPEIMDDPGLDEASHRQALRGLARLNAASRSAQTLAKPILRFARQRGLKRLRVLDVATGGGDLPIALWRNARARGVALEIHALDLSPRAVAFARESAARAKAPVEFGVADVLNDGLPVGFDIVVSSLFLHHLETGQAIQVLRDAARAARYLVLVNDLRRSGWGLALAGLATRVLSASPVVRIDGLRSVRAAFTVREAADLARRAGLNGVVVKSCWPFRYLLQWERP